MKKPLVTLALMVLAVSPAVAGSATANVSVSANIANVCTISTGAVAFGAYDPILSSGIPPLGGLCRRAFALQVAPLVLSLRFLGLV
jgi:hypothetical protein